MRRSRRLILAAAIALVLTVTALTYRLFIWPQTDPPHRVDAVLVFAGGDVERQAEGARLVRDGVAPVLVISDGGRPDSSKYRICQQPEGPSLLLERCFDGEVFTVATSLRNSSPLEMPGQVMHEWGGLVEALALDRNC